MKPEKLGKLPDEFNLKLQKTSNPLKIDESVLKQKREP
jgi:hypothetical protein